MFFACTKLPVLSCLWLALIFAAMLPGFFLDPSAVINRVMPLSMDSLEVPANINFGVLQPGEKRMATFEVRNVSWRAVQLQPIKADCGCLMVHDPPEQIAARGSAIVNVSITASTSPGNFSRSLLIQPRGSEQLKWTVLADGIVTTKLWAEPSQLNLVWADDSVGGADFKIRHDKGIRIARVVPTSASMELIPSRTRDDGTNYSVRIKSRDSSVAHSGSESIQVYLREKLDQAALTIPVRWAPTPRLAYVPQRLELPTFGEEVQSEPSVRRVLAVVVPPDRSANEALLEVLVPWVRIGQKSVNGSVLRLELEFLGDEMPAHFRQPILSARLPGDEVTQTLAAIGDRS